jgi:hypothetical protein
MSNIRKAGALLFLFLEIIFFILLASLATPCYRTFLYLAPPTLVSLLLLAYLAYPSIERTPKVMKILLVILVIGGFCIPIGTVAMTSPRGVMEALEGMLLFPNFWAMGVLALFSFKRGMFEKMKEGSKLTVFVILTAMAAFPIWFWFLWLPPPDLWFDFQILDVKLIVVEGGENIVQIKIWNTGSVDITKLTVEGDDFTIDNLLESGEVLKAGDQRTFIKRGIPLKAGRTYVLVVKAEAIYPCGGPWKSERSIIVTAVKL